MTDRYDNLAKRMECTPEEIPALIQQHAPWSGRDMCNDSITLAAEVERLREMLLNAGWPREAEELAAEALRYERAAVVAWLREVRDTSETAYASDDLDYAIAVIERGGHRKGEG